MTPTYRERLGAGALWRFLLIAAQYALLAIVVRGYHLESAGFLRIFVLGAVAFFVCHWLPERLRQPAFVLASCVGLYLLFGAQGAAWIVGLGLGLIALANLRVPFGLRIGLIVVSGALLALMRAGKWSGPWPSAIWPIFGAMFMFRLIVYLYDLKTSDGSTGKSTALAYFFMLPNACFPLFPVVDFKTFARGAVAGQKDIFATYQTGLDSMFRGILQLLLYRVVYQQFSFDITSLTTASGAAIHLVQPYLLYLKISGSFHIIVGMLHMFGYALPRTNREYFLAASFTDYWRRINIYWKDFIQKIFFNPFYFRLNRRFKGTTPLILATLISFFATWALHSYQWFWIRGSFPIVWQDIVFWSFMGLVVLGNMVYESRHGRRRSLSKPRRTLRSDILLGLRTAGTFVAICLAWAIWSARSSSELQILLSLFASARALDLVRILAALVGIGLIAVLYDRWNARSVRSPQARAAAGFRAFSIDWPILRLGVSAAVLAFAAWAPLFFYFSPAAAAVIDQFRSPLRLSGRDAQAMDRGYYEDLTDVARFNPELAELYAEKPADWERCWAIHRTGGFPTHELLPSRRVAYKGAMMSTNSHAMRDREYALERPAACVRIVLDGASHSMGSGVEDQQSYENIVEDRLNRELATSGARYEILNFSVGGLGPLSRLYHLEHRLLDFQPDAVIFVALDDIGWATREFLGGALGEYALPWPELEQMAVEWGIQPGMDRLIAESRVRPHRRELLAWLYTRFVSVAQGKSVTPYLLVIPRPRPETEEYLAQVAEQLEIAAECGVVTLDARHAYDGITPLSSLWIAKWDNHANAEGHARLADVVYDLLLPKLPRRT